MESSTEMEADLSQLKWDAVSLRMTAFPKPGSEITASDWWKSVVGEVPEQQSMSPRSGEFLELGKYGPGILELKINPVSVNWIHRLEEQQQGTVRTSLGDFTDTSENFCSLIAKWFSFDAVPSLVRLAFGAVLIQSTQSKEESLARLANYIKSVKLDPSNTFDFLYQINRRRLSNLTIDGLEINRLMKWSVGQIRVLVTHSDGRTSFIPAPSESVVQLELDINTVSDFEGEITREQLPKLFKELVELGAEIAEKGEVL